MNARAMAFKLTYSTMFDPPEELHARFEAALAAAARRPGRRPRAPCRSAADVEAAAEFEMRSPDRRATAARPLPGGDAADASAMPSRPRGPSRPGRARRWPERVRLAAARRGAHRGARLRDRRRCSRSRSARTAWRRSARRRRPPTSSRATARRWRGTRGFVRALPDDPLPGFARENRSVLKPYGVWARDRAVQLPVGARRAARSAPRSWPATPSSSRRRRDTPWAGRLLADCIRDAGFPPGVFNYVTGRGGVSGRGARRHPDVAGITFTGSLRGRHAICCGGSAGGAGRGPASPRWAARTPRSSRAARTWSARPSGIVRSAFGLSGQKCSALLARLRRGTRRGRARRAPRGARAGDRRRRPDACARTGWGR